MAEPVSFSVWQQIYRSKQEPYLKPDLPENIQKLLDRWYGSPSTLYWVRDRVISEIKSKVRIYEKNPVIGVEVVISQKVNDRIKKQIGLSNEDEFLRNLSIWLSEQIATQKMPFIVVCQVSSNQKLDKIKKEEKSEEKAEEKSENQWYKKIFKNLGTLNNGLQELIKVDINGGNINANPNVFLKVVVPKIDNSRSQKDEIYPVFGKLAIIGKNSFTELNSKLPFLSNEHLMLAVTQTAKIDQLWVKHIGNEETWIIKPDPDKNTKLVATQLPQELWYCLKENELIVLGRLVRKSSRDFIIVRGSMVLIAKGRTNKNGGS